tara:strand:- start:39 stop:428 length:390 start_codon:yes stop_codon:yes gene_type:complete
MKNFVIYNSEGTILRTGSCPDEVFALQRMGDEIIMEGVANDATQCVVDGVIVDKPDPTPTEQTAAAMFEIRQIRDSVLSGSDWTQVPDSPLSAEQRSEWQMYRQKLRDLPADYAHVTALEDVVWPTAPS